MAIALEGTAPVAPAASARGSWLQAAGLASLGAGAVHAAAIGVHAEHEAAARTFAVVATVQLVWGGLALVRSSRLVAWVGVAAGLAALAGWAAAKTTGIGLVRGLDEAEAIQTADALAAAMAAASVLLVVVGFWVLGDGGRGAIRPPLALSAAVVTAVAAFGMVSAGTHAHAAGGHDELAAPHGDDGHDSEVVAAADHDDEADDAHAEPATVPYDPTKPIDLGGVEGVTPEQQAAAENLVAVTVTRLPQWSDWQVAEAAGFRSIGDGFTGVEHFVHPGFMGDDVILDPDQPESLVYDTTGGGRRLVAAMYMVARGTPLEDVPDIGGKLMQWHTHENLCYNAEGKVRGVTDAAGNCPEGLVKPVPTPMIHVWIEPHPCGPFAALEGIGGGRIPDGEEKLCDTAHGSH